MSAHFNLKLLKSNKIILDQIIKSIVIIKKIYFIIFYNIL